MSFIFYNNSEQISIEQPTKPKYNCVNMTLQAILFIDA